MPSDDEDTTKEEKRKINTIKPITNMTYVNSGIFTSCLRVVGHTFGVTDLQLIFWVYQRFHSLFFQLITRILHGDALKFR